MSFPFDHFKEDAGVPLNTIYMLNPRYKFVQSPTDPLMFEQVLDVDETAKASLIIKNVGIPND